MIYYLDETPTPSWAGTALKCLGYDDDPERLQYLIRKFYVEATSKMQIQGVMARLRPVSPSGSQCPGRTQVPMFSEVTAEATQMRMQGWAAPSNRCNSSCYNKD